MGLEVWVCYRRVHRYLISFTFVTINYQELFLFSPILPLTPTLNSTIRKIWLWTRRRMCHLFGKWIIKPLLVTPSPILHESISVCVCVCMCVCECVCALTKMTKYLPHLSLQPTHALNLSLLQHDGRETLGFEWILTFWDHFFTF